MTDRRAKVKQAKSNSTCRICGMTGRWAGDEACPQRNQPDGKDRGKPKGKGKGKYTKFKGHIGMMALSMNAEFEHIKDHCAPVTSAPPSNVLRPCWVRGPGAIWTKSIPVETRDPAPGRGSEDRPVNSNRDADSAPKDQAEEAFLCIDDGEFDFDYDDLDFTGMMAALPESVSIASDVGMCA